MRTQNESRYILNLMEVTRNETSLVGVKAANLGELAGEEFPVPEGFALTTGAFERFLDVNNLDAESLPTGAALSVIPEEIARQVMEGVTIIGDGPLAVRSSGIAEDLPGASFAGQYETVLDVRGKDALLKAVEKCWSSAFSERVRAYRKVQGQQGTSGMAVLIQRLVEADAAGVAFTANPVTGDRSETVISAVRGLGERLVSGQATPDEWVVRGNEIFCRQAPEEAIDADQARKIAELARRVEAHFNCPQDIEWAVAGEKLYLLQARPITTLDQETIEPVPVPVDAPEGFWQREASHAPTPWTPMSSSLLYPFRNRSFARAFDEFGVLLETLELKEIGGWEYMRAVPLGGKDRPAPPPWIFWLLVHLIPQLRSRIKQCVEAVRSQKAIRFVRRWHREWQPGLETRITKLRDVDLVSLSDTDLDKHIVEVIKLFEESNDIHLLLHGALGEILGELVLTCSELLGWNDAKAFEMVNGLSEKSTEPSRRLADLAGMVRKNPTTSSMMSNIDQLTLKPLKEADPQFGAAFLEYMRDYGCRALRYEIGDPTLAESPGFVLKLIQDQIDRGYDPAADSSELKNKRTTMVKQARSALSNRTRQERERFDRVLAEAEEAYPVREDNEFYTYSAPVGLIRYGLLELGRRLAERGQIAERDDVFLLQMGEARKVFRDGSNQFELVRHRKGERAWILAHPGPLTYGEDPGPPPSFRVLPAEARMSMENFLWYMDRIFATEYSRQAEAASGLLRGIAASPGEYRGKVRIVMSESEFSKVEAGDVLVCPITSPVWSVLFPSIGALVTDTGGILSHPAIIAREYRVPAVVATGRATRVLHDDQTVKVDGIAGTVEVV